MTRIGMGLVGAGFVGPHHVDAVRRLGVVDVVALAASSDASAQAKARALGIPRSYGHYEALLDDADVHVVHVATPNHLHYPIVSAAIARGKHVVADKPLATTPADAQALLHQATRAGIVHAVTFNYRGNPLVQHARSAVARGDIGTPHFVHGRYLQDWLLNPEDYSWRLDPDQGGPSSALGDIGSHWCDLAEHVSGLRIVQVLGEMTTVIRRRRKPTPGRQAFETTASDIGFELVDIEGEDLASVLLRFANGATGSLSVGQVCAGHKNDLSLEISGAAGSIAWHQERQNELWIGHRDRPNEVLEKDPSLIVPEVGRYARLPGGHQEGWADAFFNVIRDIYNHIAERRDHERSSPRGSDQSTSGRSHLPSPAMATFADGYRAVCIVDAILRSARAGGVWTPT